MQHIDDAPRPSARTGRFTKAGPLKRPRALTLVALGGALLAATLSFGTGVAHAAYSAHVRAGTLEIDGNAASDKLSLRLAPGAPNILQLDVGEDGTADFSFDRSTFTAIAVDAGRGDDEIRIDQSGGPFTDEAITLNGGDGDDTLIGGSGAETFFGGKGDDFVDGNIGADTAFLGSGDDRFQWDPGDGSDTVEGDAGQDALDFNGSNAAEQIELAPNGARARLTRNVAAITMDLDTLEHVSLRTLGGADIVTADDLAGTDVKTFDVDLQAITGTGDGSADSVVVRGTNSADSLKLVNVGDREAVDGLAAQTRVSGDEAADAIRVEGLDGADTFTSSVAVHGQIPVHFTGGDGQDTATYNGSDQADEIGIARDATEAAVFATGAATTLVDPTVESLIVSGLDGNDTIAGQNGLATITALTLQGGDGDDDLRGGDGADTLNAGKGDDHVDGNIGADTAFLGTGDDHFQWDPGDGSDTVEGQAGNDTLDFNGSNAAEQIELTANGNRLRLTRNVANITMDTDSTEHVNIRTLGSADTTTIGNLADTDVKSVHVDLQSFDGTGDGAADSVVVRGTDGDDRLSAGNDGNDQTIEGASVDVSVFGDEAADAIRVEGLDGADTFTSSVAVHGQIPVHFTGGDGQDTATYNGSDQADEIGIARDATEAAVFATGAATTLVDPTVESLIVSGLDGNDTIAGQNGLATITALTLQGGDGDDDLRGGDGADTLNAGKGDDHVDGNIGADTAFLGTGDDHFQWDPGDGSDTVEGQAGNDTLDFNGSNAAEQIELTANGNRLRLTRNVANITMDTDSTEHVNIRTLGSADTTTIGNLAGTDVDSVDVDLRAAGGTADGAADTVVTQGSAQRDVVAVTQTGAQVTVAGFAAETHIIGSEPTLDTLRVETLAGDDDVTVAPDVTDVIATLVDLGTDE